MFINLSNLFITLFSASLPPYEMLVSYPKIIPISCKILYYTATTVDFFPEIQQKWRLSSLTTRASFCLVLPLRPKLSKSNLEINSQQSNLAVLKNKKQTWLGKLCNAYWLVVLLNMQCSKKCQICRHFCTNNHCLPARIWGESAVKVLVT